ncbi:MAG: hypothetical protein QF395_06800, partial [Arenicellales bacterium]|nr:hypothetical protein [Arenicellales bacterium]
FQGAFESVVLCGIRSRTEVDGKGHPGGAGGQQVVKHLCMITPRPGPRVELAQAGPVDGHQRGAAAGVSFQQPCVDGSLLARDLLDVDAVLVGAAMCSAC